MLRLGSKYLEYISITYSKTKFSQQLKLYFLSQVLFLIVNNIINVNFDCVQLLMSLNESTFIYRPFSISCLHVFQKNCKVHGGGTQCFWDHWTQQHEHLVC